MSASVSQPNGVDVLSVAKLSQHYAEDPEAAQTSWSARTRWQEGFRTSS
jgi:hypothetical protein